MLSFVQGLSDGQKSLLSGGIAGCTAKTLTAPLSRMTVLLQVGAVEQCHKSGAFLSLMKSINHVFKTEGLKSFWKGNFTSVIHRFPYSAINFSVYETVRDGICKDINTPETPFIRFFAGGTAGTIACFACYPLDLVKTRLTVDSRRTYSGIAGALKSIVRKDGILGLYDGLSATLAVVIPTLALTYSTYGTIKSYALKSGFETISTQSADGKETITFVGGLLCGSLTGIISTVVTYPADLVRRQMQVQGFDYHPSAFKDESDSAKKQQKKVGGHRIALNIYRKSGVRGFFRGFLPEILKITPMVAITFSTFELCSQAFNTQSSL